MRMVCLLLFLLILSFRAQASALYKCAGPNNDAISIQSKPCPAGSKQIWVRNVTSEAPMSNEQLRAREETRRQDSENARALSRLAGTDNSSDRVSNQTSSSTNDVKLRCDSAKQQAQIIRDRDSRILSVERLRQLDVWVESECKAK